MHEVKWACSRHELRSWVDVILHVHGASLLIESHVSAWPGLEAIVTA